VIILFSSV
jgi:hypothetical protein